MSSFTLTLWGSRSLPVLCRAVSSRITNFARPRHQLQVSAIHDHYRATPEMFASTAAKASDGTPSKRQKLVVKEVTADMFAAPPNSVLIHACNCYGNWGKGIAEAFRLGYPNANRNHEQFCDRGPDGMAQVGSAQLIPPMDEDLRAPKKGNKKHYIGCLFTSEGFGTKKDPPATILKHTRTAMIDLLQQIADIKKDGTEVGEIRMCKINSVLFKTPWKDTLKVLQNIELEPEMPTEVTVYERPSKP